jgi:hypothetical protein
VVTPLRFALGYGRRGWPVFPLHSIRDRRCTCSQTECSSPGKHPRTEHGLKDASTDRETIERWWGEWPDANVGIRTGAVSGLVVLDIDPRHGGDESLAALERQHGPLPDTPQSLTGGGGRHALFAHPGSSSVRNKVGIACGLDLRGDGGYIVAPPSLHVRGQRYAWDLAAHPRSLAPAPLPGWLLALTTVSAPRARCDGTPVAIPRGTRNATLASLAGSMRSRGLTEDEIAVALLAVNARCDPPLPEEEVRQIAKSIARYNPTESVGELAESTTGSPSAPPGPRVLLTRAASIRPVSVRWAWRERIPLGSVSLLVGDPGLGKSTLSIELAARLSRGQLEGDLRGSPAAVVLATAEDAIAQVVVPRLLAADADLELVRIITVERDGLTGGLVLPHDLRQVREPLLAAGVRLLVIDPLVAHLPGEVNSHRDQDVRRALAPLARLAEEADAAVLLIVHLNKASVPQVLGRVGGSIAIVAAARSMLLLGSDADDREGSTRILAHAKCNVGPLAPALRLRVEGREVEAPDGLRVMTSGLVWCGEASGVTAADLVATPDEEAEDVTEAIELLRGLLADGPVLSTEVERELRDARIAVRAWRKAKRRLGVRSDKRGFRGPWFWQLPEDGGEGVRPPQASIFDENGFGKGEKAAPNAEDGRFAEGGRAVGGGSEDGQPPTGRESDRREDEEVL